MVTLLGTLQEGPVFPSWLAYISTKLSPPEREIKKWQVNKPPLNNRLARDMGPAVPTRNLGLCPHRIYSNLQMNLPLKPSFTKDLPASYLETQKSCQMLRSKRRYHSWRVSEPMGRVKGVYGIVTKTYHLKSPANGLPAQKNVGKNGRI